MTRGSIIKAAILPGLWPRLKDLFGSGFAHIAYLIAQIYAAVRLLPQDHPYLKPDNLGRFGIRHVIAQASNNLVFSRKNIDQLLIFTLILIGIFLLIGQFIILVMALINQPAFAQAAASTSGGIAALFGTPEIGTNHDIVFRVMDRVFGIPGIFNSCISLADTQCTNIHGDAVFTPAIYPFPLHDALHGLFKYYSQGLMIVGGIVILYFVVTIIGETAVTGTPFGQRFNKAWAPVRLIVFFGLITPIGQYGLNGGQHIVLHVAKYSSNFATNGWIHFNKILTGSRNEKIAQFWSPERMIANPTIPELGSFVEFMYVAKTCEALLDSTAEPIDAYVMGGGILKDGANSKLLSSFSSLEEIKNYSSYSDIRIAFGHYDAKRHAHRPGHVNAVCGSITLPITDLKEPASIAIQENYVELIKAIYTDQAMTNSATCFAKSKMPSRQANNCTLPTPTTLKGFYDLFHARFVNDVATNNAIQKQIDNANFAGPEGLKELGWGGAGIWYNTIAEMNGAVSTAVYNLPKIRSFPTIMQKVEKARAANLTNIDVAEKYNPHMMGKKITTLSQIEREYAAAMYQSYKMWTLSDVKTTNQNEITTNAFIDTVNFLMGTGGLFSMLENQDVNPMAQLSMIGKEMIEAAVGAIAVTGGAKLLGIFKTPLQGTADIVSGFMVSIASVSLLMGFMLFYVLPILPFVYFMFAAGAWVKSVFEAMVAMPLWAIAHIRIDGEGLPGRDASNGYYLLLEIFLRPILIVFGLIAAILLFSAMAMGLNDVYLLVIDTAYGGDNPLRATGTRSAFELSTHLDSISTFFYTGTYTVMIYIIGTTSFKMIDLVPKSIMRWMGVSVSTFQESMGDPAATMSGQIYKRANLTIMLGKQSLTGGKSDPGKLVAAGVI